MTELALRAVIMAGWYLDSAAHPHASAALRPNAGTSVGRMTAGPKRLLSFLESQLGLSRPGTPEAERISEYMCCLLRTAHPDAFYARSLALDPWSSAKELLRWRDELMLAGWNGRAGPDAPRRLRDLAAVEREEGCVTECPGERLRDVGTRLAAGRDARIGSITLVDAESLWPRRWRDVFAALRAGGTLIEAQAAPFRTVDNDLGRLQAFLQAGAVSAAAADGSVVLLTAESEIDAAEALADWLAADPSGNDDVVIVRNAGSGLLDGELRVRNLPRAGLGVRSPWRAALQVLPLALEMHWRPFDPQRTLEFLSLPKNPLTGDAAYRLARALTRHPGRDGPEWTRAVELAVASRRWRLVQEAETALASGAADFQPAEDFDVVTADSDAVTAESSAAANQGAPSPTLRPPDEEVIRRLEDLPPGRKAWITRRLNALTRSIARWLPTETHCPDEGIPAALAAAVCAGVAQWALSWARQADGLTGTLLLRAAGQAETLARVIGRSGLERIERRVLNRMIDNVIGDGVSIPGLEAQAAAWRTVDLPGQVFGPAGTLVWWGFVDDTTPTAMPPWTAEECAWLRAEGTDPEDPRAERRRARAGDIRAVLETRERLFLVAPLCRDGAPKAPHPLWGDVKMALQIRNTDSRIRHSTTDLRRAAATTIAGRTLARRAGTIHSFPVPRRTWTVPPADVAAGGRIAPTTLQRLLQCSFAWVADTSGALRPSPFRRLPDEPRIIGNLAHEVVRVLYEGATAVGDAEAGTQVPAIYDDLVAKMAAPLLGEGRHHEHAQIRDEVVRNILYLVARLNAAGLEVIAVEKDLSRPFGDAGLRLEGRLDVLLRLPDARTFILDLKWALQERRYADLLTDGKAVQLAAYSAAIAHGSGSGDDGPWPQAGFFMLRQGELYASSHEPFVDAHISGPALREVYRNTVAAAEQVFAGLRDGHAFATGVIMDSGIAPGQLPLVLDPPCRYCDKQPLCRAPLN
jgi:hypothetical protein